MLGLYTACRLSLVVTSEDDSLVAMLRLLTAVASLVVEQGLSYSAAWGIFLDQGLNPCTMHWQVDS